MTAQARNNDTKGFTEFSDWLRNNTALDSNSGYLATNIDFMWRDYNTKEWMLIEEKRKNAPVKRWQMEMFTIIDTACKTDDNYRGFWFLKFENTNPMDGATSLQRLDSGKIHQASPDELTRFLSFKKWSPPAGVSLADEKERRIAERYG
jgi:hypothetical protein